MGENKERITISIDPDLLRQIDEICEKSGEPRSAMIERVLRWRVPEEQEALRDAENPVYRALIAAFKESPALLGMVAKIAGRTLTQDQIAQMQESTKEQLRRGKERQRPRKGRPGAVISVNTL